MADVMVVAIFMAFIGFRSILTEQLHQIEQMSPTIDILSTNKSSLQIGFFIFTSFVVLSLMIAQRIEHFKPRALREKPKKIEKVSSSN
jgi:hypothetical protein